MSFYIGFFGWVLYIALCMVYNYVKIERFKIKPRYLVSNIWRVMFALVSLIVMSASDGFNGLDLAYFRTYIQYIPNFIFILSSFYLFFDAGLNWLRGKAIDYKGDDSGWTDSMKLAFYYALKALCFIAVIWSTV